MSQNDKRELRKQYAELAKGLAEINSPKSPQEVLLSQIVADRESRRDPKDFFKSGTKPIRVAQVQIQEQVV